MRIGDRVNIADRLASLRPLSVHHSRVIAVAVIGVLVGTTAVAGITAKVVADQRAAAEYAAAQELEQRFVDYWLGALDRLKPMGTQIVHDATAWADSGSPLLTEIDVSSLQSTARAVQGVMRGAPAPDATSAQLEALFASRWAVITGGRERMATFSASVLAVAKAHLDAAPIADAASRQALVDAMPRSIPRSRRATEWQQPWTP